MSYLPPITESDVIDGLYLRYLKFFGLWGVINDYRTTGKRNRIIKFQLLITLMFAVPYIFTQYLSFFVIKVDIQKATFLNLHTLPAIQICCKIMVIWFRLDSQCRLFNLVRKDFIYIPEYNREAANKIFKEISNKANILCIAAFIVNTAVIISSIAVPGISVDYILYHTGNMDAITSGRKKILGGWYPLQMDESPHYEIVFVYETTFILWAGILLAVYISLFYQVLMCLYAQFSVLCIHVSSLRSDPDAEKKYRNRKVDSEIYKELYIIIRNHQKLLSYANELRSVYNPLVTMILGIGIFVLIIAVFQFLFGSPGNPTFIFKSLLFLAYQGIEVCMFCFGSSYVETASSDLHFAIYSSDWYKADIKFQKAAQMMMIRTRKGVTLTAIRMYNINVETMMSIFQFTYTVSAFMSRMNE
ncbi:odorant receptor 24a-like [Halyomorpha halys]|uniref:odorant receptor 24a-like n=1 Tax=Halyomorpha halys TaxID=286706 RepID=UPI0034D2C9A0|nr:Odorant receptor 53 [Halyomorpha halys]